jgi:CheY-like chemotaxis protein
MAAPIYHVTEAGRKAWQTRDLSVPSDYRTILWVMDFHGADHLQSLMSLFPEQRLGDCLAEMAEIQLIEPVPHAQNEQAIPLEHSSSSILAIAQDELPHAVEALANHGAYVSAERVKSGGRFGKTPSDTTVLVVEDDPDQAALADLRVSMAGYSVQVAASQSAMLKTMAEKGKPDLLLLDVVLPDGDGFAIVKRFRRLASFSSMPIVLLTARREPAHIIEGLRVGADGYVTKPYSKSILASVIDCVLRVRRP